MKRQSLYFEGPREVSVRTETLPEPDAQEVLVHTLVSAVSAGTELLLYRGQIPIGMAVDETIAALGGSFAFPLKYGYAAVGRVTQRGSAVGPEWEDRLVFAFQPHESDFTARPEQLIALPDDLPPETAVFLPNMETAVSFLMDAQPMIGEQAAVFGQGVVGLLTTSLLAQMPLASLVTLDRYAPRRTRSREFGAHASLDPGADNWLAQLQAHLQGDRPYRGADLTFELSGQPQALDQAIQATGYSGRILIGSWYGQKRADINLGGQFHRSHMRLISSQVSHVAPQWRGRFTKARRLQFAQSLLAQHRPERLITHRIPFTEAEQAYTLLDQRPQEAIQIVFVYE